MAARPASGDRFSWPHQIPAGMIIRHDCFHNGRQQWDAPSYGRRIYIRRDSDILPSDNGAALAYWLLPA